ncbi:MAG: tRNA (N(6)-L-threonylcarbamoyladenosine(37)-C(2))-methylthiotransferase [Candidatus Helarchaeota archaeon]
MVKSTNFIQVLTFGCSMNIAESEMIEGMLQNSGYLLVDDSEKADVIFLNSCFVKNPTESKLISKVKILLKKYPKKKFVIGGCMPEVRSDYLEKLFPTVSLIGTSVLHEIPKYIPKILRGKIIKAYKSPKKFKLGYPRKLKNNLIGIIPISEGCNNNCYFCCTRLARGEILSYPIKLILKEIGHLLDNGCKEFWITAQDTAAYQENSKNLVDLLNEINKFEQNFFYRVGMMNPSNLKRILPRFLGMLNEKKMYKFIHLPLQSGSDKILELMNRKYRTYEYMTMVNKMRKKSRITLATDIIVGYPDESDKNFKDSIEIIKKIKPDIVNISQFGARPKTRASRMTNKIQSNIIKQRSRELTRICEEIIWNKNKEWINWEGKVLISEKGKKSGLIGRNFCYKPILIKDDRAKLGDIIKIKIDAIGKGYLIGSPIN